LKIVENRLNCWQIACCKCFAANSSSIALKRHRNSSLLGPPLRLINYYNMLLNEVLFELDKEIIFLMKFHLLSWCFIKDQLKYWHSNHYNEILIDFRCFMITNFVDILIFEDFHTSKAVIWSILSLLNIFNELSFEFDDISDKIKQT